MRAAAVVVAAALACASQAAAQEAEPAPAAPSASKTNRPTAPGGVTAAVGDDEAVAAAFTQHYGLSLVLGGVPAAASAFLFVLPWGAFAAPLLAVAPFVGAVVAVPITNALNDREGGYVGATLGWAAAALPLYASMGLVGTVPLVDGLARGNAFDPAAPPLSFAGAGVLAGAAFLAAATTALFSSVGYAAETALDDEDAHE